MNLTSCTDGGNDVSLEPSSALRTHDTVDTSSKSILEKDKSFVTLTERASDLPCLSSFLSPPLHSGVPLTTSPLDFIPPAPSPATHFHTPLEDQVLGLPLEETDFLSPRRGCVEDVEAFKRGDVYIGRGNRQRDLAPSTWGNPHKVKEHGREVAIAKFASHLSDSIERQEKLRALEGECLLCQCTMDQSCHGDVIISAFRSKYPDAYVIGVTTEPPSDICRSCCRPCARRHC